VRDIEIVGGLSVALEQGTLDSRPSGVSRMRAKVATRNARPTAFGRSGPSERCTLSNGLWRLGDRARRSAEPCLVW
jgi:hypothetical protein